MFTASAKDGPVFVQYSGLEEEPELMFVLELESPTNCYR